MSIRAFPLIKDIKTANYADYLHSKPYVCCGWMDFHVDDPVYESDPDQWTIKPHFWSRKAGFVHRVGDQYVLVRPTKEEVTFNYKKLHALLPIDIAEQVIEKQHFNFLAYRRFARSAKKLVTAKMVWTWQKNGETETPDDIKLTDFQKQCLHALIKLGGIASADEVADMMKKDNGRLAVTSAFRAILEKYAPANFSACEWICRVGRRDQWSGVKWAVRDKMYYHLGYQFVDGDWIFNAGKN